MNADAWRDFPGAPEPGAVLCAIAELPKAGVKSVDLNGFPVLLVASADGLRAYVNACPHQYLPLDWRTANILFDDGERLRCSNHAWGFDACTGAGLDGGAEGCALDPLPVHVVGDTVRVGPGAG